MVWLLLECFQTRIWGIIFYSSLLEPDDEVVVARQIMIATRLARRSAFDWLSALSAGGT